MANNPSRIPRIGTERMEKPRGRGRGAERDTEFGWAIASLFERVVLAPTALPEGKIARIPEELRSFSNSATV